MLLLVVRVDSKMTFHGALGFVGGKGGFQAGYQWPLTTVPLSKRPLHPIRFATFCAVLMDVLTSHVGTDA